MVPEILQQPDYPLEITARNAVFLIEPLPVPCAIRFLESVVVAIADVVLAVDRNPGHHVKMEVARVVNRHAPSLEPQLVRVVFVLPESSVGFVDVVFGVASGGSGS